MKQAIARAWSRFSFWERFIAIVLITLWVIGTVYVVLQLVRVADVAFSAAADVFFLPYVVVTVLVVVWLLWLLVRGGRHHGA
ncbi:MAG: hypothetical protein VKJ87_05830 [Synechococcus sp.]|nr:hypothetical protein [Synechococcus sp.]